MTQGRYTLRLLSLFLTPMVLLASFFVGSAPTRVVASSHREAPLIASEPDADNTDTFAFISPDRPDSVTLIANYIPLEHPEGGPNYHKFSESVLYEINVDNVGDGKAHLTYQFRFQTTTRNPNTFLYNTGQVTSLTDPDLNVTQTYTVTQITRLNGVPAVTTTLASGLPVPPVNVGSKSTPQPQYDALAAAAVRSIGSGVSEIKVFAGPRDDGFFVDLGSVFDLLSLRGQAPPIGYAPGPTIGVDAVSGYNVHSISLQVPIIQLTAPASADTVIGVWATASRQSTRVLAPLGGVTHSGPFIQVSRLALPLVNEVVIPRALKDAFNGLKPEQDFDVFQASPLLQTSILTPELQTLLGALYGVPNPGKPRTDILAIFLTGMKTTKPFTINTAGGAVTLPAGFNVNQPLGAGAAGVRPAEMIRLNTAAPFRPNTVGSVCAPTPNYALGLLGGDACGFPNGRRLQDDVTDIELLAVAGAAYSVLTNDTFAFNPALVDVLSDSVDTNDLPFLPKFPYQATPHQGQEHYHETITRIFLSFVAKSGVARTATP